MSTTLLPKLFFGTYNANKLAEVAVMLAGRYVVVSAADFPGLQEADETGRTLEANALLKAQAYHAATGLPCFADDSGLEVAALHGEPGVDSAHYSGSRDAGANIAKLLDALQGQTDRSARFRTVIAYVAPDSPPMLFEGTLEGSITATPRGSNGFGYDPVFQPFGDDRTLAEHSAAEKNAISHRARALQAFLTHLTSDAR